MDLLISLTSCARRLGTSTRKLRYRLEKDKPVPDRRMQAGKYLVRYMTAQDYQIIKEWWALVLEGDKHE